VLVKEKAKGRRAFNANGSRQRDTNSLKYADGARDPWLLATSLPYHRHLSKQVIDIYRQRMQIEEGFRDMKSTRFGLGYENNRSTTKTRITVLVLLTTLASLVAVLLGMLLVVSNKHRRFQANTETKSVLSFHFLGLRAFNTSMRFTLHQWKKTIRWLDELTAEACMSKITC
jgi:transposase